jgi:hypothetical protein
MGPVTTCGGGPAVGRKGTGGGCPFAGMAKGGAAPAEASGGDKKND